MTIFDRVAPFCLTHREALEWLHRVVSNRQGPLKVAEIGTWKGGSALVLADALVKAGGGTLLCVDDWSGFNGKDGRRSATLDVRGEFIQNLEAEFGNLAQGQTIFQDRKTILHCHFEGVPLVVNLDGRGSPRAAEMFPVRTLDFCFIDGDHTYAGVLADLKAWLPKMKPGALVAGHDFSGEPGVNEAVREVFGSELIQQMPGDIWAVYV